MRAVIVFSSIIIATAIDPDFIKEDQIDWIAKGIMVLVLFDIAEFVKKVF